MSTESSPGMGGLTRSTQGRKGDWGPGHTGVRKDMDPTIYHYRENPVMLLKKKRRVEDL